MNKSKKEKKVSFIAKAIIMLTLGFGIKLFISCTPHSQIPIEINYNKINVVGVDNSGRFLDYYSIKDTLYSDAIALKLTLSDTLCLFTSAYFPNTMQAFSFQTLLAKSFDPSYIPQDKVVEIKVKTLLDIDEFIKAGDDISEQILCATPDNFVMYYNLSHGISWLNGVQHCENSSIVLILKSSVKNSNAQFEVVVILESGDKLLWVTEQFTIIES